MDFGQILSQAWKITWKFKVLWIFGIFASRGTGGGSKFNGGSFPNYGSNGAGNPGRAPNLPPGFIAGMDQSGQFFQNLFAATLIGIGSYGTPSLPVLILAGLGIIAYIPVSIILYGIVFTYSQTVWTLTYLRLTKPLPVEPTPDLIPANA